ncbi:uncharacterized protein LOC135206154 isoform X2 [Macrobrachium nipponense]|uniref:uncharacterized protein LOC135206154 isoform X2 n=1 Tax=Macrobrachium nipponense TaxID=159736 RepID=UPI0030C7D241
MTCHIAPYSGYELRANLEGLLKKFRVTKENEKEEEIFTLANLDNGCIRKFIVKKVDESAFLASINNKSIKEEIKSLKDENENTAVLEGGEDHGDGQPLVLNDALSASTERLSDSHKDDNKKNESLVNGQLKNLNSGKPARFKVGGDDSDDSMPCEEKEDKDDPGVVNPTFFTDDEDDICRGDESTASVSTRSSPDLSPSHSPRLSFNMSAPVSPRHSPVSHRSGNLSHRSSVSSVRKGILKKSGSSSTINMEMVNLGLQQNAALNAAANSASGMNGYHKARFTDPYDECYVPVDTHRFVSAPDESSGMTQKSLGGHRVKFILETGKPDHVNGDYDDIRIEKMERERIERIERGKNLEVTNNSGDKGGRKCLLFCAAMLVLTASVITAGLYGSGRLGMITSYGKTGIPKNGGDGSNGFGSQGKADSFKTIYYVPNALEVRFKINNRMYNDTLSDIESSEYKNLSSDLENKLSTLLLEPHNGKAELSLKIIKFEPGSIICTFRIAWTYYSGLFGEKSPPLNVTVVQDKLEQTLSKKDDPAFEGYDVLPDSLQVSALADKCKNNETKCSHNCVFRQKGSLRFECSCPDHLILRQDKTNCYSHAEEEKKKVNFKNAISDVLRSDAVLVQIKTEVKDEEKEEVEPAKPDESKKTENATATSATDAAQPGSGDIVHSQEGVGNTTLITESGMVNGTLTGSEQITSNGTNIVNGTGMDINNTTDTVQLNATNKVMNTTGTEFNVTSVDGHVTNETLANGTVHMHPFTINGTIVAEHPLLNLSGKFDEFFVSPGTRGETQEIFTNSSKVLPPQDLSDLRPGGSPGDARLQTLDVPEENMGIFNESHQTSDNSSSIVTDINTLHDEDGMGNAFNHTQQENTTLNESFPSVQTNFSSQSPVDTHTTTTTQQSTVNTMSGDPEVKVTKVPNEQNEEETQEITRVEDKSPPLVRTTIQSTTRETTNGEQEINSNISEGATQENTSGDTQTISHNSDESRVNDNNSGLPISIDTILDTSSNLGMIGITSDLGNSTSHEITTKATTSVMVPAAPELKDKTSVHTQTEDEHISQSDKGILTTTQSPQLKVNCTEEMFECVNGNSPVGSRIPYTARCNSIPDCSDGSDELNCIENNCFDNFKCRDNECIERQYVCDGIANCRDGEDEMNCESWECRDCEFKCTGPEPSPCIPLSLTCDGQPDCFDHSDEVNCSTSCKTEEFQCKEGWCIPIARKCDGIQDCYGGEDESECDCLLDLTSCAMGGCVPKFQLCDGLRNCADGSDEWKCIRIENGTNQLEVSVMTNGTGNQVPFSSPVLKTATVIRGENRWVGVCGEGWTYEWSDLACQHLGSVTTYSMQVTRVSDVPRHRVKLASTQKPSSNTPLQFTLKSECESDKLVQLTCDPPAACGSWQDFTNVEAMEGITPAEHVWPSLVLVRDVNSNSTCTASILTPYWVLAAYSCVYTKKDGLIPDTWVVQTGTAGQGHNYLVANMISYPGKVRRGGIWSGDAVLLLLEKPLKLDEKTQPICIPDAPPPTDGNCVVAGWNRSRDGTISQDQFIHSVAVPTLEVDACNTTHYPGRLTNAHTCIGFTQAQNPPCQGDEGTPLMCKSKSGVWRIEGLSSHHGRCGRSQHPSVFTALHALQPWLSNTIGLPSSYGMPTETTIPTTSTTTTSTATTVTTTATEKPSSATLPPPSLNSEDFDRPQVSSPGNAPL